MPKYIALLRGINVSGQKKIIMSELRDQLTSFGLKNVKTYIQSGNIIFDYKISKKEHLIEIICDIIEKHFGFIVTCIILKPEEIGTILKQNPFLNKTKDTKYLYYSILSEHSNYIEFSKIDIDSKMDEFYIKDNVIYVFAPGGYGKSKFF